MLSKSVEHVHAVRGAAQSRTARIGDPDELVRIGKRQRTQEQRIDDAEHSGIGADSQSKDNRRDEDDGGSRRKPRTA